MRSVCKLRCGRFLISSLLRIVFGALNFDPFKEVLLDRIGFLLCLVFLKAIILKERREHIGTKETQTQSHSISRVFQGNVKTPSLQRKKSS
ncbi:hypothetical protein BC830DRAFT_224781 [Chytriomyces sp. MP71]|nr:hypothetical protein BC830DRAFT_224781 [Chytriomyces sp. MP71]